MKNIRINHNKNFGGTELTIEYLLENKVKKDNKFIIKLIAGVIIGFVNGFWGGGGGMICVPILMRFIGLPEKVSHATTLLIMLPLSIASLVVYFLNGNLNLYLSTWIGFGFILGGICGALILKKISNMWLGIVFSIVIIVGGIKMLL